MKELNKNQVEQLINYLNHRIERNEKVAMRYRQANARELSHYAEGQRSEADHALNYLLGLIEGEE